LEQAKYYDDGYDSSNNNVTQNALPCTTFLNDFHSIPTATSKGSGSSGGGGSSDDEGSDRMNGLVR